MSGISSRLITGKADMADNDVFLLFAYGSRKKSRYCNQVVKHLVRGEVEKTEQIFFKIDGTLKIQMNKFFFQWIALP